MTVIEINSQEHAIKSVTVFRSQIAEILRVFPLQLKAGRNQIKINSLPGAISTNSISVSGLGSTRLYDFSCVVDDSSYSSQEDGSEVTAALTKRVNNLQGEKRVYDKEAWILENYSESLPERELSSEDMNAHLNLFVERYKRNTATVGSLEEAITDVGKKIEEEKGKSGMKKGPRLNGEVTIVIGADIDTNIDLKLTYTLGGVTWWPVYELYGTSKNGKLSSTVTLKYMAHINQETGEDWADVALTLSSSITPIDPSVPDMPSIKLVRINPAPAFPFQPTSDSSTPHRDDPSSRKSVRFSAFPMSYPVIHEGFEPPSGTGLGGPWELPPRAPSPPQILGGSAMGGANAPDSSEEESFADDFEDIVPVSSSTSTFVINDSTKLVTTYAVQGKPTISSDGIAHIINIADLDLDVEAKYVAIPRVEAAVYQQWEVKNTNEYRLLPGLAKVFMDEIFVSSISVSDINAGDIFTFTLGIDPAIKITYIRNETRSDTKSATKACTFNTTCYTAKISITNKHAFALNDVVIREAFPVVDVVNQKIGVTEKAKVILRKPFGLIDAKVGEVLGLDSLQLQDGIGASDGLRARWQNPEDSHLDGDKDGKFEWFGGLKAGEKVELEASWDIKTPEDVKWVEINVA